MQNDNNFQNPMPGAAPAPQPAPMPGPAPTPQPAPMPEQPMAPLGQAPMTPEATPPKKSKAGLIIGIVVALVIIIVAVVLVAILNGNKSGDDGKKDNNSSQESGKEEQKTINKDELSLGIDDKTVTIYGNFQNTIKSFVDAGYKLTYTSSDDFSDHKITTSNIEEIFSTEVSSGTTMSVDIEDGDEKHIATVAGSYANYDENKEEKVKPSTFDVLYMHLEPAQLAFNDKKLDANTATINDIQSSLGKYDEYDSDNDVYSYRSVNGFGLEFFMTDGKIEFISIRKASGI